MEYKYMVFPGFKDKAVTFSYDDGVVYDKRLVEIFNKNGLKGTFNINSGLFSKASARRLSVEEALELYTKYGHEIAIHGKVHLSLAAVSAAKAVEEVINDRIALEEIFGTIITGMAYANGSYNDNVVEILKNCGVHYARTINSTERFDIPDDWLRLPATCHHENPRLMELATEFIDGKNYRGPKLFYVWGHSYEFNDNNNWNIIEEFARYIGNRSDIWYATNIEIYRYVKAFDALEFNPKGDKVFNPTAIDVYMKIYNREYMVPSGKITEISFKEE